MLLSEWPDYVFPANFQYKINIVGRMRTYTWNILQWDKNKTKSMKMTQWRLLGLYHNFGSLVKLLKLDQLVLLLILCCSNLPLLGFFLQEPVWSNQRPIRDTRSLIIGLPNLKLKTLIRVSQKIISRTKSCICDFG